MAGRDVFHYSIPAFDVDGDGQLEYGDQIGSAKLRVRGDELLVSRLNPRKARIVETRRHSQVAVCSGEFVVLRPMAIERRYLKYVFLSEPTRQQLDSATQSVTRSHQRVDPELISKLRIDVPEPRQQRAIANFLDTETVRIDDLMQRRERQQELVSDRFAGVVEHRIRRLTEELGDVPLRHAAESIVVGIVITPAAWYADEGVLALRGVNIRPGRLDLSDTVRLTPEGHAHNRKSELNTGDVVVVRTGQAGVAAVVPPELAGSNCIDLLRVRPATGLVSEYLAFVLNSDWTQKHIAEHSVGSIQAHFNVGSLKALQIPLPSLDVQHQVVRELEREAMIHGRLEAACERQVALLQEHRQALITAAVTGQLDLARDIAEEAS
jgi:type I restriction enzyme S subunit